jgi:uncharacterized protein DUF6542
VLLAVTLTAVGFAYDAGSGAKELSTVFAAAYAVGCVAAVLAVRQAGLFTAVIQPPLILFVAVPTAYFLFHGSQITGIKDTLINFGYPLIERFPVMFFTSAAVLLIGMARWYYGMSTRRAAPASSTEESTGTGLTSKMSSLFNRQSADSDEDIADADETEAPRRRHTVERPSRPAKAAAANSTRTGRPAKRVTPSRSRHARPPDTEIIEPVAERPRRPRSSRQTESPPPAEPRRRPRTSSTGRKAVPPSADRRTGYDRTERRRRYDDYEPQEPHGTNGNGTHHPVSRVRYRGDADDAERRTEYRTPPRSRREREPDSWEYDI